MNIAIIGINYAPEVTGIGPYTTELAEHLADSNRVTVLTGFPHYPDWIAAPYTSDSPNEGGVSGDGSLAIRRYRHYVPTQQTALRRAMYEGSWALNTARSVVAVHPDVVVAVVPALLGAAVGRLIRRTSNAPLGVIVQDVMSSAALQSGISGGASAARPLAAIERNLLRSADGVVTIHSSLADALARDFELSRRPHVIHNWSRITASTSESSLDMRMKLGWMPSEYVVLHSGNMGLKQGLETIIDAGKVAAARSIPIRFVIAGGGSQSHALQVLASSVPNVDVIPGVDDASFPSLLGAADALLVNERRSMAHASLPSKLTSYFVAGKPIIAAVASDGASAQFLASSGGSVITPAEDSRALVEVVDRLRADPSRARSLAQAGSRFANLYLSRSVALESYTDWIQQLFNR